jgi:hypothetical protein
VVHTPQCQRTHALGAWLRGAQQPWLPPVHWTGPCFMTNAAAGPLQPPQPAPQAHTLGLHTRRGQHGWCTWQHNRRAYAAPSPLHAASTGCRLASNIQDCCSAQMCRSAALTPTHPLSATARGSTCGWQPMQARQGWCNRDAACPHATGSRTSHTQPAQAGQNKRQRHSQTTC